MLITHVPLSSRASLRVLHRAPIRLQPMKQQRPYYNHNHKVLPRSLTVPQPFCRSSCSYYSTSVPLKQSDFSDRTPTGDFGTRNPPKIEKQILEETIQEIERLTEDYQSSAHAEEYLFPRFANIEDTLISWLTEVARREVKEGTRPDAHEIDRIKHIHRFYHAYVPFLQVFLSEYKLPVSCNVYIAHSGLDKAVYAERIKDHLDQQAVPGVFLDKRMPSGGNPVEHMLYRAVTAPVFWFIASRNIVLSKWPMRELMIAYVRHQTQDVKKTCLLMDCLETEPYACGLWSHAFRKCISLRLFNRTGHEQPFPANMQQMQSNESLDDRIKNLAEVKLLSGTSIINFADDQGEPQTLTGVKSGSTIHKDFPESFRERCSKAKSIKIIATWLNLAFLLEEMVCALSEGASLQVFLLSPDSPICAHRSKALQEQSSIPVYPDAVVDGINRTLDEIEYIRGQAMRKSSLDEPPRVEVRFWDSLPSVPIIQIDDWMLHGYYLHNRTINPGPWVEIPPGDFCSNVLLHEIEVLEAISFAPKH